MASPFQPITLEEANARERVILSTSIYKDRWGKPITPRKAAELFKDFEYRHVATTMKLIGKVSTVWVGMFSHYDNTPYETCIFFGNESYVMAWYNTVEEAREGHKVHSGKYYWYVLQWAWKKFTLALRGYRGWFDL